MKPEEQKMEGSTEVAIVEQRTEMQAILDLAKDPAMDVEKLKALVTMQEGILNRQAKQAFAEAFVSMKPHLKRIENKHKNTQTNSKYSKLEDINKDIDPILEQFGFATMTPVLRQTEKTVTVGVIILHKMGYQEQSELTLPLDDVGMQGKVNKTAPHAIASSIKFCRRIALCAALNVSTGDGVDTDGNFHSDTVSIEQAAEIDLKLREAAKTYAKPEQYIRNFCVHMGVESDVRQIRAKDLQKAFNAIKPKAKEQSP